MRQTEEGAALLIVLLLSMACLMLSGGLLATGLSHKATLVQSRERTRALMAADAGVRQTVIDLQARRISDTGHEADPSWQAEIPTQSIGDGVSYRGTVSHLAGGSPGSCQLLVTGISAARGRACLRVVLNSDVTGFRLDRAVFADDTLTLSGGGYTDSYDSSVGPYDLALIPKGVQGNAGSNNDITTSGNSSFYGAVAAKDALSMSGGTVTGKATAGGAVSGSGTTFAAGATVVPGLPRVDLPNIDAQAAAFATSNSNATGITYSDPSKGSYDPATRNLTCSGITAFLAPGTYYFQNVTLSGGARITLSGPTTIYVTGKLASSGGGTINNPASPQDLQLYGTSTCTSIGLSGSGNFSGILYAPTALIDVSGGGNCFGTVIGRTIKATGGTKIHRDISLSGRQIGGSVVGFRIMSWRQLT